MAELVTTALQVIQFIVQINNQVQFNKKQCHRLVQRIEQFRPALQRLHTQPIDNDVIKSNLFRLIDFLQEAKRFIGKFVDKHYLMKAFDRNIDYETFTDLNDTLTELVNLLQFGIVCNTIEQHQHDLQDREEDQIELKHILINMKDEIRSLTNVNHIEMIEKFNKMHKEQMEEIQKQKELMLQIANNSPINSPVSPSPAIVRHVMHLDENMMKLLVEQIKAVQLSIISENNSPMTSTGTAGSANSTGSTRSTGVTSPQNTLPPLLKIDSTQVLCDRSATGTLLGGGGFGDVYRGTMAGANVAVKYLRDSSAATLKALKKEALILQIISTHPAIIRYYGIQLDIPPCYLVMEYAICSLYDLLYLEEKDENAQTTITMVVARLTKDNTCIGRKIQLLYETSCALQHLHSLQVTHRDIKPMNILISIDGKAKLTDFGLAKVKHIAVTQTSVGIQKGTATYMPPEILLSEDEETIEYNEKTDVYGFGILMNEVLDHNKPFPNIKMNQLLNKMIRDNNTRPALFYEDIDMKTSSGDGIILELQTLIQRSWNTLQEERPSFQFIAQKLCRIGKRIGTLIPQQPARISTFSPVNSTPNSPVRSAETSTGDSGLSMKSVEQALPSPPPAVRLPSAPAPPPPPPPAPKIEYLPVGSVFELSQEVLLSKETSKQVLITESRNGNPWSKAALMCLHATGCNIIPEQTSEAQSLARELFAWLGSESPPNSANARYAHHYLSYIFQYGLGGQAKDSAMSFWHLKQSADIGLPASCALVGYRYMRGTDGADKNPTLAVRYLKQAIDAHDFRGQCWYGSCCEEGIGMNVDASNAMTHYKLSANKGFRDAQHLVGNLYERGFGCIVDIEEAKRWYTLASNQGYQSSKDALARIRSGKTLGTPPVPVARSAPAPAIQPAAVPARVTPPPTASTPSATTTNVMALREYHRLHNQIRVNNRSALQTLEQRISQGIIYAKATVMMLTYSNYSIILPEDKTRSAALSREVLPWLDITAKKTNVPLNSFEEEEVLFAKFFLAKCLFDGIHMTKDVARGFQLIKNCVDRNYDFRAKGTIGHCYIEGVGVTKDTTLGFRYSKEAADSGDYQSIFNVGWCYDNGVGVTRDYNEAMKYYRKAADAGFTDAYSCLGVIYEEGKGVPKDLEEANKWFQLGKDNKCSFSIRGAIRIQTQLANQRQFRNLIRSTHKSCSECSEIFTRVRLNQTSALQLLENEVRANNYWAIGNMAVIAFVGVHIYAKNQSRGIELATQARPFLEYFAVNSTNNEEKGYASVILARYYFEGLSVAKDVSRCYMYASMANDSRISRGVGSYAYYVSEGIGCTKDVEKGVRLTKIAADGGDYQSMHNYAWYLERGVGVAKDGVTALAYYKRAADMGFVDSQDNTGHCYENGIGTPKNLAEARRYYTLAAAQGSSYATTALNRIGGSTSASSSSKSGFFRKMFG